MEAVVSLLAGLPLQPEEGDGVELMEAKSQLFLKYGAHVKDSKHSCMIQCSSEIFKNLCLLSF